MHNQFQFSYRKLKFSKYISTMASTVASSLTKIRNLRDFKLSRKSVSKRFQKYYVSTPSHISNIGTLWVICIANVLIIWEKKSFGDIIFLMGINRPNRRFTIGAVYADVSGLFHCQRGTCGVACESRCILALQRSNTAGVCAGIVGVDVVGDHVCALADVAEEDVGCRVACLAV